MMETRSEAGKNSGTDSKAKVRCKCKYMQLKKSIARVEQEWATSAWAGPHRVSPEDADTVTEPRIITILLILILILTLLINTDIYQYSY